MCEWEDGWINGWIDGEVSTGISVHMQELLGHFIQHLTLLFLGTLPLTAWPQLLLPVASRFLQLQAAQILSRQVF